MSVVRVDRREAPFVQIDKTPLESGALSWKAKGLLSYLLTRPDDWTVRPSHLQTVSTDGRDATYSGLEELYEAGYIDKRQRRDENGHFDGHEYVVYELPELNDASTPTDRDTDSPDTDSPDTDSPDTENPRPTNKEDSNKEGTKNSGSGRHAHTGAGGSSGDSMPEKPKPPGGKNPFRGDPPDWLPEDEERFLDAMADCFEQYGQDPQDRSADLLQLAKNQWWRGSGGGRQPDIEQNTATNHVKEYPWPKVVAAYVISRRADVPQSYADTVLDNDFQQPSNSHDGSTQTATDAKQRPAESYERIRSAVEDARLVDG